LGDLIRLSTNANAIGGFDDQWYWSDTVYYGDDGEGYTMW
jgi:hypothetical protein